MGIYQKYVKNLSKIYQKYIQNSYNRIKIIQYSSVLAYIHV